MTLSDPLSYEATLSALQSLFGRPVTVFVGGAADEPGLVAYSVGILHSAEPDPGLDVLYAMHREPIGEALHFRVVDEAGVPRFVFVVFERFFGHGYLADRTLIVTQRATDADPAGLAIWIRPED